LDFQQELETLREEKRRLEEEIESIEEKLSRKTDNTESLRDDLERLTESIETGEVPDTVGSEQESASSADGIEPVDLNPETGRPSRGARSDQIEQAIRVLSERKDEDEFRAAELFELLSEADPSVGENQQAYLYSKLDDLRDEGKLEKVKRGTWRLAD